MSADAVKAEILEPMRQLFLPPNRLTEEEQITSLRQYVAALEQYDASVLRQAWAMVRDKYTKVGWPPIGMFVVECRRLAGLGMSGAQQRREKQNSERSARWARWKDACHSPLGQRAADEGWAFGLRMEILEGGKTVGQIIISEILAAKAQAEREVDRIKQLEVPNAIQRHILLLAEHREKAEYEAKLEVAQAHEGVAA